MGILRKKHSCKFCQESFHKVEELMQHEQVVHESKFYECHDCKQSFEGMEQMRDHAKKYHSYNKLKGK